MERIGWEEAKDACPEVRRFLQTLGASVREHDPDFWLYLALAKIDGADRLSIPVVVTDCRYRNEAKVLRDYGFKIVRIVRPETENGDTHESETALDAWPVDVTLMNSGSLSDLRSAVDALTS